VAAMRERNQKEQMKSDIERGVHTGHCVQRIVRCLGFDFMAFMSEICRTSSDIRCPKASSAAVTFSGLTSAHLLQPNQNLGLWAIRQLRKKISLRCALLLQSTLLDAASAKRPRKNKSISHAGESIQICQIACNLIPGSLFGGRLRIPPITLIPSLQRPPINFHVAEMVSLGNKLANKLALIVISDARCHLMQLIKQSLFFWRTWHKSMSAAMTPNAKVSDGSQPPMTFDFYCELNGWLPFAAPSGSPFLVWPSSWIVGGRVYQSPLSSRG
jgi:hypothetical protein